MSIKSFKHFLIEEKQQTASKPVQSTITQQEPQQPKEDYHKTFHSNLQKNFGKEYPVIMGALKRNNIQDTDYDNVALAFAIRKSEAGKQGKEFGVLSPGAGMKPGETPEQTLDRQAGWAAASIVKNRERFKQSGGKQNFIEFMGNRWAPVGVKNDPTNLNKNWIGNVSKFHGSYIQCTGPNCNKQSAGQ